MISLFVVNTIVASFSETKRAPSHSTLTGQEPKRKTVRDHILLTGPSFAGKTQLYFKLIGGTPGITVSSSSVNETAKEVDVKVPTRLLQSGSQEATPEGESAFTKIGTKLVDVPGHYNFRKTVQAEASGAKAIVLLLDAKEKTKYGEAAEILYDILGDIENVSEQIPVLVACNKQDIPFAKNPLQLEREIANEIEQIRKVRRASQQQENDTANRAEDLAGEDEREQESYLESLKGKFSFEQVPNKVQFCGCSVKNDQIDDILRFIAEYA